jgi:hypothetical protein
MSSRNLAILRQKSAERIVEQNASSRKAKAWYDLIKSILQKIQVREKEDVNWCARNCEYNHMQ